MNTLKNKLGLYLVTDRSWADEKGLCQQVEASLKNGVTFLQLREKDLAKEKFLVLAKEMKNIAKDYQVPFVINDAVDIALACDADGVHIGQEDDDVVKTRERLGEGKILGVSVGTVDEAVKAVKEGADYLGVGAMFPTMTKDDASAIAFDTLRGICDAVDVPVVAIGGINSDNIKELKGGGICGVAVVSAILAKEDCGAAAEELRNKCDVLFSEVRDNE
ncbi:thiamine phosphate synthase [Vallitalea okinawensis]|uniref:thiamine phosphate synthase n=1 Tax=Vallitalea okinawensis TaxID=2078660 RepID=UPI000CFCD820|nr:thiamine phosphate synthase [Vallitalea okinawensis]